jgi:type II secretion system protein N
MEKSRKYFIYWMVVLLYAVALFVGLLYLRFPGERFKEYCVYRIEKLFPGASCTIAEIGYEFPAKVIFQQLRLTGKDNNDLLFEDPQFSLQPVWSRLSEVVYIESRAFGGNHSALIDIEPNKGSVVLEDVVIKEADLGAITLFQRTDRTLSGRLSGKGSAAIHQQSLAVEAAKGSFTVSNFKFELAVPIFRLSTIDLDQSTFQLKIDQNVIELQDGKMSNSKIDGMFQGTVMLAEPLSISKLALTGNIIPKVELFQGENQLQAIVSGIQRRYNSDEVPFRVGGSINSPTFIFGK